MLALNELLKIKFYGVGYEFKDKEADKFTEFIKKTNCRNCCRNYFSDWGDYCLNS